MVFMQRQRVNHLLLPAHVVIRTSKMNIYPTSMLGGHCQKVAPIACCMCSTIIFPPSAFLVHYQILHNACPREHALLAVLCPFLVFQPIIDTFTHAHGKPCNKSIMQWRKLMFLSGQNMALYGLQSYYAIHTKAMINQR